MSKIAVCDFVDIKSKLNKNGFVQSMTMDELITYHFGGFFPQAWRGTGHQESGAPVRMWQIKCQIIREYLEEVVGEYKWP